MKTYIPLFLVIVFLSSCTTVDVERRVRPDTGGGTETAGPDEPRIAYLDPGPPEIVYIEKPVYVPEGTPYVPPPSGRAAVTSSNAEGILEPQDYSKAVMIYDYDGDWVYEVYTQPLRATDICLEPGEQAAEIPYISDSDRWLLGAGVSRENGQEVQHIYVKPKAHSLEASLIINTDRRVYHLIVKSFRDVHMPVVRWRYPGRDMPGSFSGPSVRSNEASLFPGSPSVDNGEQIPGPDPRFLSFNYRITYGWFRKPRWLPSLAYDDGRKTYITFPLDISQGELPAIFEDRSNIVNYRVAGTVIIIDKLIEKITVKKDGREVIIEKKKG
jgi:type IV secretion system protein VirB9